MPVSFSAPSPVGQHNRNKLAHAIIPQQPPKNTAIYIPNKSHLPILSVEIWDVTGKLISKIPGPNKKQLILDKSHLPNPGTYLIMVHTQENTVVEKLLVF